MDVTATIANALPVSYYKLCNQREKQLRQKCEWCTSARNKLREGNNGYGIEGERNGDRKRERERKVVEQSRVRGRNAKR